MFLLFPCSLAFCINSELNFTYHVPCPLLYSLWRAENFWTKRPGTWNDECDQATITNHKSQLRWIKQLLLTSQNVEAVVQMDKNNFTNQV